MVPPDEESRILDPCPNCTGLIDVSALEPFSEIHCPMCGTRMLGRKQFNSFALQRVLGEGGMGTVFEAIDLNLQRPVAVKILKREFSADAANITQLETEARVTASISHPHVVRIFSAGQDHGQFYLAMELVGRGTLDELMSLQGQVAEVQVLEVGIQIADGLRAAARKGLIHRDVKPGNILFSDAHTAKMVDFGLAVLMEDAAKNRGEIWGTPYYVAPEKLNEEPEDFRSDIYSLGGTLFHALAGRPPFEAASASLVALKHLKSQAVSLQAFAPNVSSETAFVINRMLHKDPLERYQSYDELIEHLKYARTQLMERSARGRKEKARVVVESEETRSFTAWITLGLVGLTVALSGFVWMKRATFFPTAQTAGPKTAVAEPPAENDAAYREAVHLLARGRVDDASTLFDQIIASPQTRQPRANWSIFQKGLGYYLNSQPDEARELFAKLQAAGLYSQESSEVRLAGFFVESGRVLKRKSAIPPAVTRGYSNADFEAMALLAFAFKNWSMAHFAEAEPFLRKFSEGKLEEEYAWIAAYTETAKRYLADETLYATAVAKVKAAKTPEEKSAALRVVQASSRQLVTSGLMPAQFQDWEETLRREIASGQELQKEQAANVAQQTLSDETAKWHELSRAVPAAEKNFAPEAVLTILKNATFRKEAILHKKRLVEQRLGFLAELKIKLIAGLRGASYDAPISKRSGAILPGKIVRATVENVYLQSDYGETLAAWKDVSTSSVAAMAGKLVADPNPEHKKWLIGVYLTLCGSEPAGKQMLVEAAQADETLRDDLAVFFEPVD